MTAGRRVATVWDAWAHRGTLDWLWVTPAHNKTPFVLWMRWQTMLWLYQGVTVHKEWAPVPEQRRTERKLFFFFFIIIKSADTHSAPSQLRPISLAECTQVRKRTDKARCQNSTCSARSYFCGSALKYSICLQLNPRCATTSSAECLLRLPPTPRGLRNTCGTHTHTLRQAKATKRTSLLGKEKN